MQYLTEGNAVVDSRQPACMKHRLFEFNLDKMDYFMNHKLSWITIDAAVFRLEIGEGIFDIPSGSYVLIGDNSGEIDWIRVDEMIDRQIECVTLDDNMATWAVDVPVLMDYYNQGVFHWPMTHHVMPIVSNGRLLLVSTRDQHHRTRDELVSIFLGH